jgi:dynein heavy chain
VTRQHEKDNWALDDVVEQTDVKEFEKEKVRDMPAEGVYIHGLFLEGARYTTSDGGRLDELAGKDTFDAMPIIHMYAKAKDKGAKGGRDIENYGMYVCPTYKYPKRTDKYFICSINLRCEGSTGNAQYWKLRGVALLCSIG